MGTARAAAGSTQAAIRELFEASLRAKQVFLDENVAALERAIELVAAALAGGRKVLLFGNGGSAADAQHIAAELVGRYQKERRALPAIALTTDTSALTSIANDYGYDEVFARQVRAHGRPGDVLVLLSTSGRSPNLLAAAEAAAPIGMVRWALTGPGPNPLVEACDDALAVSSPDQQTVQELHLVSVHLLCAHVEAALPEPLTRPRSHLRLERRR